MRYLPYLLAALSALLLSTVPGQADISANLLRNPAFEEGMSADGVPVGWSRYEGGAPGQELRLVENAGSKGKALLLADGSTSAELGITQSIPARAGETYQASAQVRPIAKDSANGAYMQLRFLPSNQFAQVELAAVKPGKFTTISVKATAPAGTQNATLYLYTHREPAPRLLLDNVSLISGVTPPPPAPSLATAPQYDRLKDLHRATDLVREGQARIVLVVPASGLYREQAARIQAAIRSITGVVVPIVSDTQPQATVPLRGSLIVLGNRSTNRTSEELYNRYFTLTDLRYPGPGGYEVRTLHNPFGNGHNAILVGGSDAAGVNAAANALITKLKEAGGQRGTLALGWLMDIRLGRGITVPRELKDFETWEASRGYGSSGYFGWNSLSKRLAMYYMTGDPAQAREFLRLAFPDRQAFDEITRIDEERIENKEDPLAGPYHYNAHLMILFWDLVEESPVFTDAERLKVTNAFARQFNHRKDEGVYGLTQPASGVGDRHGMWSANSLYCLARYFARDYPGPIWEQSLAGVRNFYAPLRRSAWIQGESDNLFWYCTATAPVLTYMLLSGDREPLRSGALRTLLRGQDALISGRQPDWALNSAALDYLNKAAYLTGDGRFLLYRDRTGVDTGIFRLGQSFWPDTTLRPAPPRDLAGKWNINPLPLPLWQGRGNGFPPDQSFFFGSFRSTTDSRGDYILLDGFNGASRNPYHTFAILELRLNGHTLLQGYRNQVLTHADGLVEPKIAMDAALRTREVLGQTALAVGEVPNAAFCNWRRSLAQRIGRYALVVDDLRFRADSDNIAVQTLWETRGGKWRQAENAINIQSQEDRPLPPGWRRIRALASHMTCSADSPDPLVRLNDLGIILLRAEQPGPWLEMQFSLDKPFAGEAYVDLLNYTDRGKVRFFLDGKPIGALFDHFASSVEARRAPLGRCRLAAGTHRLRVQVAEKASGSTRCNVGLAGLLLRPEGASAAEDTANYTLTPSDPLHGTESDGYTTLEWQGAARSGQHRIFFSLLAPRTGNTPQCLRLAENAAALALPRPALALVGDYTGNHAELAVLAADHLYGKALTRAAAVVPLIISTAPVDLDWDYRTGILAIASAKPARLSLPLAAASGLRLDGKPVRANIRDGLYTLSLAPGRHRFTGAKPSAGALRRLADFLNSRLRQARQERQQRLAAAAQAPQLNVPRLKPTLTASLGGRIVATATIPAESGTLLCAAEGHTVHLLAADGQEVRRLTTDGPIRVLRWWQEARLLLVGCQDEKVIAFTPSGERRWEFVSQMDPAVFRAAKQYWFKSAPGHEGIHGLYTGEFLNGKTQCFVGSACTLEILDENGQLIKRLPVFWGPGAVFQIVPAPDGSRNLLVGRDITDGAHLAVVSSKTLSVVSHNFNAVPPGATYVGGWASMNRSHLFYADLDGDGTREVASEINGSWNRVTIWKADGTPLYDASFGPGAAIPAKNMRDLAIADLNGDGKQEILVATAGGLVVALDCRCRKVWAQRLPEAPTVLQVVTPRGGGAPWIVAGCQGGGIYSLDGKGAILRQGRVDGAPTCVDVLDAPTGPLATFSTDTGALAGFAIAP